jgi:hypothetical protein
MVRTCSGVSRIYEKGNSMSREIEYRIWQCPPHAFGCRSTFSRTWQIGSVLIESNDLLSEWLSNLWRKRWWLSHVLGRAADHW